MNQPPYFLETPESFEITEGDAMDIVCKASGLPLPQIGWFKNGQPTDEHVQCEMQEDIDNNWVVGKLVVPESDPEKDTGTYTMEATNKVGAASHDITVTGKRKSFNFNIYIFNQIIHN